MKHFLVVFCFLSFLLAIPGKAQVDSVHLNKQYITKYWTDTKKIVTSPLHWNGKDWQRFGAFAITTGALLLADEPVNEWMQDHRTTTLDKISKHGLDPFDIEYTIATCGLLYGGSLLLKDRKLESTTLLAFESYALASVFVRIPKKMLGRKRPNRGDNVSAFDFEGPFNDNSFPSGHTIAVFSVATVFANQYRETIWVPVSAYSLAGLVGLSRVYDNHHWLSDVFAGAVMGIAIGNMVCPVNKKRQLSVLPVRMGPAYGLRLAYHLK